MKSAKMKAKMRENHLNLCLQTPPLMSHTVEGNVSNNTVTHWEGFIGKKSSWDSNPHFSSFMPSVLSITPWLTTSVSCYCFVKYVHVQLAGPQSLFKPSPGFFSGHLFGS